MSDLVSAAIQQRNLDAAEDDDGREDQDAEPKVGSLFGEGALALMWEGELVEIDLDDFDGIDSRRFRDATGMGFVQALQSALDLDVLIPFVWLKLRKDKRIPKNTPWTKLAKGFTYGKLNESMEAAAAFKADQAAAAKAAGDLDDDGDEPPTVTAGDYKSLDPTTTGVGS
jgi:hypothetical protein